MNLEQFITKELISKGITANLKGYHYLRLALIKVINNQMKYIDTITSKLYPEIAKEFSTTASRVERAIRHAIGKTPNPIANGEFIFTFADEYNQNLLIPHASRPC